MRRDAAFSGVAIAEEPDMDQPTCWHLEGIYSSPDAFALRSGGAGKQPVFNNCCLAGGDDDPRAELIAEEFIFADHPRIWLIEKDEGRASVWVSADRFSNAAVDDDAYEGRCG